MSLLKLRPLYVCLVALGVVCLYLSVGSWTLFRGEPPTLFRGEPPLFRKDHEFLQLPALDCEQDAPFLLLLVTSLPEQASTREVIRSTWGGVRTALGRPVRSFFLLGSPGRPAVRAQLAQEGRRHGDLIQKDFVDVYSNLTLKTMMGMQWVQHFCPQAAFVMKTDTDMFINVPYLVELLVRRNRTSRFITGFLMMNNSPIRNQNNKWFVSKEEYPGDRYPPFCSGIGYIFSGDVAAQVYNVSDSVPFFRLEDVFVGLCLQRVGIVPEPLHSEQTFFPEGLPFSPCRFRRVVACHHVKPQDILKYWDALERSRGQKCPP